MTLLAERTRPASPGSAPTGGRSPGRRWRLVVVVLAVVAAYVAVPLFVRLDGGTPQVAAGAGLDVEGFGRGGAVFLHYEHGRTVTVTVPLHNPTPLPLSVGDVVPPPHPKPLVSLESVSGTESVPPMSTRPVELTLRFGNCRYYHERAAQTVDHLTVSGSALGRDFTAEVPITVPLVVHGQVILNCPDRTLVRGDDRR